MNLDSFVSKPLPEKNHPFRFVAAGLPGTPFHVLSFAGREAISELYAFDVTVAAPGGPELFEALEPMLLGQRATLNIGDSGGGRDVRGIVTGFRIDGELQTAGAWAALRLSLGPRAWLLTQRTNSRIFQDKSVPEMVAIVLGEWGIRHAFRLTCTYPRRTYATQYRETDYAFVARLLAEEGIFFFFEHPLTDLAGPEGAVTPPMHVTAEASGEVLCEETMVFTDSTQGYRPLVVQGDALGSALSFVAGALSSPLTPGATLRARHSGDALVNDADHVVDFVMTRELRTKSTLLADYDFRRPDLTLRPRAVLGAEPTMDACVSLPRPASSRPPEPRAVVATPSAVPASLMQAYLHHDEPEYEQATAYTEVDVARARMVLEQLRRDTYLGRGRTYGRRLVPGYTFVLEDHAVDRLNQAYTLTSVVHRGIDSSLAGDREPVYEAVFECVPAGTAYRPPVPSRELRAATETAIVVGPPNEDVWVDEHGRVRVHFHWDVARPSEYSSCWLRVAQPWTGAGFGAQFIPRVGTEVVVTFLGGDPDRPMVTGGVHNGRTPVPFTLPKQKNKSGIRTRSTPGGVGFNELSFDDTRDAEVLRLRAQRDKEVEVGNDRRASVGHNDALTVGSDQELSVKGDRRVDVCGSQSVAVAGNASRDVSGDVIESAGADARRHVARHATDTVGANLRVIVGGECVRETRGTELVRTGGDAVQQVMGCATTTVVGNASCQIGGSLDVTVGDEAEERNASLVVHGNLYASAQGELVLRADRGLTIQCGSTTLSIGPDGVKIDGKILTLTGSEAVTLTGKGPTLSLTDKVEIAADAVTVLTKGASLVLDQNAALRGAVVKLNPSDRPTHTGQKAGDKAPETRALRLTLVDRSYRPYAGKPYQLLVDGRVIEGKTGGDGSVNEQVPSGAKTAELVLFTGVYPTGPRQRYALSLESIGDCETPQGQQLRLKNLGHYHGPTDGEPHDSFRDALAAFQRAHALEESGVADPATLDALRDKHGH